jgi:hypothetical protein
MRVALTINDFLRRAVEVFPERVAVVDEPGEKEREKKKIKKRRDEKIEIEE